MTDAEFEHHSVGALLQFLLADNGGDKQRLGIERLSIGDADRISIAPLVRPGVGVVRPSNVQVDVPVLGHVT